MGSTRRDFEASTLWRISEFERIRIETGNSGYIGLERQTVLSSTIHAELQQLQRLQPSIDVVETVTRLAQEIARENLKIRPNCAARTLAADIVPIIEISQKVGMRCG